ncbi:hypothetical protein ACFYTF_29115 [Nocardia thailandica]|uniref:Uncharacterized protein n=1 Tax=Nocardia thailandica TaxID=257275 RepID=A0ABW6PWZ1_9NOCA
MTPTQYSTSLDAALRYVGALLTAPIGSIEFRVGRALAPLTDTERVRYLARLKQSTSARESEIGLDLWMILAGTQETQLATLAGQAVAL